MFGQTPPVIKNLLIINAIMFLATIMLERAGIDLGVLLGLHHWTSDFFNPIQFVTYLFMHGGTTHLFFNMFALWMFGRMLEQRWGGKRFLTYYIVTGIGAALIQLTVISFSLNSLEAQVANFQNSPSLELFYNLVVENTKDIPPEYIPAQFSEMKHFYNNKWLADPNNTSLINEAREYADVLLNYYRNIETIGASGSVFGILLAFGMIFPNLQLFLLFPPIPIKAKYLVIGYGVIELVYGIMNKPGDNVAHFAHLGGMLFGYLMIKYWRRKSTNFF